MRKYQKKKKVFQVVIDLCHPRTKMGFVTAFTCLQKLNFR